MDKRWRSRAPLQLPVACGRNKPKPPAGRLNGGGFADDINSVRASSGKPPDLRNSEAKGRSAQLTEKNNHPFEQCSSNDRCSCIMGIQERKLREREALRRQIIAIATEQFSKGGFEAVKMRDIAEAAEYSVGTIYNQFEDKDTLFLAVQEAAFEHALEHMQAAVSRDMDPIDELHAIGEAYIRFGLAHPHLYRLMFMLDSPMKALDRPEGWSCGLQMHQLLSAVVNECMEVGALPQVDPVQMSFALWSMVHGMVSLRITERLDIYSGEHLPDVPPILNPDDMMLKTMRMVHNLFAEQA